MSSGYCTKLGTEHCSIIRIVLCGTTFTLLKKRCQCFVDAPMLRSHRRQRPLTDNKEKPQPTDLYIYNWIACGVCSIIVWFADNVPPSLCSTSACAVQIQLFQSYSAGVLRHVCAAMQYNNTPLHSSEVRMLTRGHWLTYLGQLE